MEGSGGTANRVKACSPEGREGYVEVIVSPPHAEIGTLTFRLDDLLLALGAPPKEQTDADEYSRTK